MNGMRTASKDFGDLVAEMKEIQFERGKADPQIYKDSKSQAAIASHVDDPILAASHQQTAFVWNRIGEHMLLQRGTRLLLGIWCLCRPVGLLFLARIGFLSSLRPGRQNLSMPFSFHSLLS